MTTQHTPGPWEYNSADLGMVRVFRGMPGTGLSQAIADIEICPEKEANARLIAEAGTVATECGLSPRELLAQRDELLEALESTVFELGQDGRFNTDDIKRTISKTRGQV